MAPSHDRLVGLRRASHSDQRLSNGSTTSADSSKYMTEKVDHTHGTDSAPDRGSVVGMPEEKQQPTPPQDEQNERRESRERSPTEGQGTGEAEYLHGLRLALVVLALCLSVFVMALDNSIIATAIPRITDEFRSLSDVGWYGSSYLLTTAALQLFFGRLYTFFSIKIVFLTTITIFEIGSLICGLARNSITLIMGRAIAGIGSAGIFAGALLCLAHSVPLAKRPLYYGCIGSMWGVAAVAGPLLGGVFTDKVNWRWCFLINLPIGVVTLIVIGLYFRDPHREIQPSTAMQRFRQLDPIGQFLFIPAVVLLFLVLQWGGTAYPWSDARIIGLIIVSAALFCAFIYVQYRIGDDATVSPRIFSRRTIWASSFYAFNTGAAYILSVYFLPMWFQTVKGASAVDSGLFTVPLLVSIALVTVLAGLLVTYFGYYAPFMIVGSTLAAIGYGLFHILTPQTPYAISIILQVVAGVGIGLGLQQPLMAVQTVLSLADIPTGTAIIMFLQTMGAALAVAVGQTVFQNRLVEGMIRLVPSLTPHIVLEIGVTSIQTSAGIPAELLPEVTGVYNDALTQTFLVSAVMAALSCVGAALVEWRSVKGERQEREDVA